MSFLVLFSPLLNGKYEKLNSQKLKHSPRESVFNLVNLFSPFYYQYTIYLNIKKICLTLRHYLITLILLSFYYYIIDIKKD